MTGDFVYLPSALLASHRASEFYSPMFYTHNVTFAVAGVNCSFMQTQKSVFQLR